MEEYKIKYLQSLSNLQSQQGVEEQSEVGQEQIQENSQKKQYLVNECWNQNTYQNDEFKEIINKSFYNDKHNINEFKNRATFNPEVTSLRFNMRKTPISEYSNAVYNGRVFVNPSFTSC